MFENSEADNLLDYVAQGNLTYELGKLKKTWEQQRKKLVIS